MGKPKNKKAKQSNDEINSPDLNNADEELSGLVKAIDGHNTHGWTNDEIRAYNELVIERQKLEKQRRELEEKCAKSQTQRALLHENVANIENVFKQQKSLAGTFVFTGGGRCCVDLDAPNGCHHEICKRAKTEGVSDLELDTIKYYSMRIHTEKSERIRNALRKQRDLELVRVKKEEDEGQARNIGKSSKKFKSSYADPPKLAVRGSRGKDMSRAAKETEKIVNKIIGQLDDLRSDLQTGRITAEEAQGKLNILDSKLPLVQDKGHSTSVEGSADSTNQDAISSANSFQAHLRDRLLGAKNDTFSQAFSIMDHFLSATKPDDLQDAISELKDVLQLTGPMCDELQNSLGALEGIFDHPDKLSFTGPDGKQECNSIIDLMEKLKETLRRTGRLPDGANASLTKVFQDCIDLEAQAHKEMSQTCCDTTVVCADVHFILDKIKEKYVAKSPIPPLTSSKLEIYIVSLLGVYDATILLDKVRSGLGGTALEASITSLVILRTQKQAGKFVENLESLNSACQDATNQAGVPTLSKAIANVLTKMKKWVPKSDTNRRELDGTNAKDSTLTTPAPTQLKVKTMNEKTSDALADSSQPHLLPQTSSRTEPSVVPSGKTGELSPQDLKTSVAKHGLWHAFEAHREKKLLGIDTATVKKFEAYQVDTRALVAGTMSTVEDTVYHLYKIGLCPGIAAALICQSLCEIAQQPDHDFQAYMKQFTTCIERLPPPITLEWSSAFQRLTLAITQLYVTIHVECQDIFPTTQASQFAIRTVEVVTKFVQLARTEQASQENLRTFADFLNLCLASNAEQVSGSLEEAFIRYDRLCTGDTLRCRSTGSCSLHMQSIQMPFRPNKEQGECPTTKQQAMAVADDSLVEVSSGQSSSLPALFPLDPQDTPFAAGSGSARRIRPMKTTVWYPPNIDKQQVQQPARKRDDQYAECVKKAMVMYEAEAKKAFMISKSCGDEHGAPNTLSLNGLLSALNVVLDAAESDIYYTMKDAEKLGVDTTSTTSRFSEHLHEVGPSDELINKSVTSIQTYFTQARNRRIASNYVNSVIQTIQKRATSGRYSNPIDAVASFATVIARVGKLTNALKTTLAKAENAIRTSLEDPGEWLVCETRRLKHLLGVVGATEPGVTSMLRMALKQPSAFYEYYEINLDKLEESETLKAKALEQAWSDIAKLAQSSTLEATSPSLLDFVQHAREDWQQRLRDIAEHQLGTGGIFVANDRGSDAMPSGSTHLVNEPAKITKSPAKQPVIEGRSLQASATPLHALLTDTSSAHGDLMVDSLSNAKVAKDGPVIKESDNTIPHANGDIHNNEYAVLQDLVPESDDSDTGEAEPMPESEPASTRMRKMMTHLKALQKNAADLGETADETGGLDPGMGSLFGSIAENVRAQVKTYTEFVEQFAEWNGVDLARLDDPDYFKQ